MWFQISQSYRMGATGIAKICTPHECKSLYEIIAPQTERVFPEFFDFETSIETSLDGRFAPERGCETAARCAIPGGSPR